MSRLLGRQPSDELQFISIKRITFTTRTTRTNNGKHCFTTRTTDATSILLLRLEQVAEVPGKKKTFFSKEQTNYSLYKPVITKGYGVRATTIEGQNAFAPSLCFA